MQPLLRIPLLLVAAFVFLVVPSAIGFYTDWLWFGEVGYQSVFLRRLTAQSMLGALVFFGAFLLLFGNLQTALRALREPYLLFGPSTAQVKPVVIDRGQIRSIVTIGAVVVSLFVGMLSSGQWLTALRMLHATPFGEADPILGRDISFYIFQLPFLGFIRGILLVVVFVALAGSAGLYVLSGALAYSPARGLVVRTSARRHLSLLVAALFLLLSFGAYLDVPGLLLSSEGLIHGATFVDVEARMPALRILMVAGLAGAILAAVQGFTTASWPIPAAAALYIVVALAGAGYAAIVQRLVVSPNEQVKETPFIEHNIAATRKAFALNQIEERELSGDENLTREDITANPETIGNVRLWDHQPLLDTFGQIQEIRTYYDFASVDNDRYLIDGNYRQIMLSARELNPQSLPNRSWINERLVFTHGYGLALGPVNQVTHEGLPVLFIKNLPPESSVDLKVDQPSIYFGELSSDHVFVKTQAREFHYPKGEDNVYSEYEGSGGVSVGSFLRKLLFSVKFRSFKLFLSNDITPESRVLFHRNVMERMTTIAPFLRYDDDPYLVVSDGQLYWICDAYTITDRYPYSTGVTAGINYIRNSVKIVIDAYDGTTTFYLADPDDPLAATLSRIFPDLFRPLGELSADLRGHLRYPEGIFGLQTAVFSTYHMTNPAVFYNKEDQWEVPSIDTDGQPSPMQPYYTIMKLPGEDSAEFIQMLPFTPRRKDNLAAWMVARSDGEHYGRLLAFQFPKQKVVFGPRQIVARISQDQVISPQITLWNQQGSQVIWGTLLVIPIEESLLYVRPLYLRAAGGRIPELKRVIVGYQNQIVMDETLDAGLDRIFGGGAGRGGGIEARPEQVPTDPGAEVSAAASAGSPDLAGLARQHYERAIQAQREGNWALYGEEIRRLGEVLDRMAKR